MIKTAIQELQDDLCVWADETFGESNRLIPILNHLKSEVGELCETPTDIMEFADCVILLLEAAQHAGYNTDDLISAARKKLEINKLRKWGNPNADGYVEHID